MGNETSFGTAAGDSQNSWIRSRAPSGYVGGFILTDSSGADWYVWVDTTGDLRVSATEPTAPQSDGTVIGSQS